MNLQDCEVVRLKGRSLSGDARALRSVECDPQETEIGCHVCGAVGFAKRHSVKVMCRSCAEETE